MHLSKRAQIAHPKANKAPIVVLREYADFVDVFSPKLVSELPEYEINNYIIELKDDCQTQYGLFYSLEPVELETLKAYIKNNLANGFIKIRPF